MAAFSLSSPIKSCSAICGQAWTLLVHSPFADRHLELAKQPGSLGSRAVHFCVGALEKMPLLGAPVTIVEGLARAALSPCLQRREEELHFTERDIEILSKDAFGLRHVTGKEQQDKECAQGMTYGCSLNLSRQLLKDEDPYDRSRLVDLFVNNRQQAVAEFEAGVDRFIEGCLWFDLAPNIDDINQIKADDYCKSVDSCRFMFLRYISISRFGVYDIRDFKRWGNGLGRFPKRNVPAKQIKALPALTCDEYATKAERQGVITRETLPTFQKRVIAKYRTVIISTLRENEHTFFAETPPQEHKKSS
ncbi:MAG: hypothetical protein ACHQT8_02620 [Chlamydiales bacterium]